MQEYLLNLRPSVDIKIRKMHVLQVQEAQRVPKKMTAKRSMPRHIIIQMPKVKNKDRILKTVRKKKSVT